MAIDRSTVAAAVGGALVAGVASALIVGGTSGAAPADAAAQSNAVSRSEFVGLNRRTIASIKRANNNRTSVEELRAAGVQGAAGPQGPVGATGPTGPSGPIGPAGGVDLSKLVRVSAAAASTVVPGPITGSTAMCPPGAVAIAGEWQVTGTTSGVQILDSRRQLGGATGTTEQWRVSARNTGTENFQLLTTVRCALP